MAAHIEKFGHLAEVQEHRVDQLLPGGTRRVALCKGLGEGLSKRLERLLANVVAGSIEGRLDHREVVDVQGSRRKHDLACIRTAHGAIPGQGVLSRSVELYRQ